MQNPVEIIIQKYGYDYKSARNLVDDPYVKDLMNEIKELKKET